MDKKDILEKAIRKAVKNGWRANETWQLFTRAEYIDEDLWEFHCDDTWYQSTVEPIIFSQDFAKALWPEPKDIHERANRLAGGYEVSWKHHLQQMVIAEDPIKYLGENI